MPLDYIAPEERVVACLNRDAVDGIGDSARQNRRWSRPRRIGPRRSQSGRILNHDPSAAHPRHAWRVASVPRDFIMKTLSRFVIPTLLVSVGLTPPLFAGKVQAFTGKEADFSRYKTFQW